MSDLHVNVDHMVASAGTTIGHGNDLAACHTAADNRLSAASPGWQGRSAAALTERAAMWAARHNALITRIGEHAADLHDGACRYAANEDLRAADMAELPPT